MDDEPQTTEPGPEPVVAVAVNAADQDYAAAVIVKQAQATADEAKQFVAQLPADQLAALVDAGRNGRVAECRQILGL